MKGGDPVFKVPLPNDTPFKIGSFTNGCDRVFFMRIGIFLIAFLATFCEGLIDCFIIRLWRFRFLTLCS